MIFDKDVLDTIAEKLKQKKQTVAAAESVTGGLLQAAFTCAEDASMFFQGGITAYNIGQKYRHLLVDPIHALSCDSVSLEVAESMAIQICDLFASTYGLATTGYATFSKEKKVNKLYTFYAISKHKQIVDSGEINSKLSEGFETQVFFVQTILVKFLDYLKSSSQI